MLWHASKEKSWICILKYKKTFQIVHIYANPQKGKGIEAELNIHCFCSSPFFFKIKELCFSTPLLRINSFRYTDIAFFALKDSRKAVMTSARNLNVRLEGLEGLFQLWCICDPVKRVLWRKRGIKSIWTA